MSELRDALAEARAFLAWEAELGGPGVARVALPSAHPQASAPVAPASPARPRASASPPSTSPSSSGAAIAPIDGEREPLASVTTSDAKRRLELLAEEAASCTDCRLSAGRTRSVFSRGSISARLVFVGEGPGYNEDKSGVPFVGEAGQLLDKMIVAMGYAPDDVYICNVVKCRPPENRTPEPDEAVACARFLRGQLECVQPRVVVALGRTAAERLGAMPSGGRAWRGQWATWRGIPVMPTYHPAYLLRTPDHKRLVWEDLKLVMARLAAP